MPVKYIFITGGVVSGLGKGVTAASLGRLLKARGYKVRNQKFDPYINVNPAKMNPYQHGEVFVTDDGAEGDLDIGHYERFVDENLDSQSDITTGKIYWSVISKERKGEYIGGTVQVIPHITNEIKDSLHKTAENNNTEIVIAEIGGTVGDIEGLPFLEAMRQVSADVGRKNCMFIHVTLVPYISGSHELKTKPTQHSTKRLLALGIQPDIIVCRCEGIMPKDVRTKIGLFCNVSVDSVIVNSNVESIYEVPLRLEKDGLANTVLERLGLEQRKPDLDEWMDIVKKIKSADKEVKVAIVGMYSRFKDSCFSVTQALYHGGIENKAKVEIEWIDSEGLTKENIGNKLLGCGGVVIPGAMGDGGMDGKLLAIEYARNNDMPLFAISQGMQLLTIEYARNVLGFENANSLEFDEKTSFPLFVLKKIDNNEKSKLRLGLYNGLLKEGTLINKIYSKEIIKERHRNKYEFNLEYKKKFEDGGFVFSAMSPDEKFVEAVEINAHNWYVGVNFHPEFKSRPNRAHPLFNDFINKCLID